MFLLRFEPAEGSVGNEEKLCSLYQVMFEMLKPFIVSGNGE